MRVFHWAVVSGLQSLQFQVVSHYWERREGQTTVKPSLASCAQLSATAASLNAAPERRTHSPSSRTELALEREAWLLNLGQGHPVIIQWWTKGEKAVQTNYK